MRDHVSHLIVRRTVIRLLAGVQGTDLRFLVHAIHIWHHWLTEESKLGLVQELNVVGTLKVVILLLLLKGSVAVARLEVIHTSSTGLFL